MKDKLFLDTNILVYMANKDSIFHEKVINKFEEIEEEFEFWISRQVLREYAVIMTRDEIYDKPIKYEAVCEDIEKWEKIFYVADETEELTANLMKMIKRYKITGKKIHDTNIVASMIVYGINNLFTLNVNDFKRFKEIKLLK